MLQPASTQQTLPGFPELKNSDKRKVHLGRAVNLESFKEGEVSFDLNVERNARIREVEEKL